MRLTASSSHALAALLLATPLAAQGAPPDLDRYVGRVMKIFTVPGLSVAIVKDGRVVVAKGYGVRRLGDPAPVDERTRFGIASRRRNAVVSRSTSPRGRPVRRSQKSMG